MRSSFFSTYPRSAAVTSILWPVTLSCIAVSFELFTLTLIRLSKVACGPGWASAFDGGAEPRAPKGATSGALTFASVPLVDAHSRGQCPSPRDIWPLCGVRPGYLHRTTPPQYDRRSKASRRLLL